MEKECEIVQDLLLSYNDGVLSNSSKQLVENHLKNCSECREVLKEIQNENREQAPKKEIDYLKKIRRKLNKKTALISLSIIIMVIIIVFNLLVLKNYNETACLMEIYLDDNVTNEQITNIKETILETNTRSCEIEYRTKEQEFEIVKSLMKKPSLLEGLTSNDFPNVFYVKADIKDIKSIENAIKTMQGVKSVNAYIDDNPYLLFLYKK